MSYKAGKVEPDQEVIPASVFNDAFKEVERLGNFVGGDGVDASNGAGFNVEIRPQDQLVPAQVAAGGIAAAPAGTVTSGLVYLMRADLETRTWNSDTTRVYNNADVEYEEGDEVLLYKWQEQLWVASVGSGSGGTTSAQTLRCLCQELPSYYLVEVECGSCGPTFRWNKCDEVTVESPSKMPRIWRLTITAGAVGSDDECDECATWAGDVIDLEIEMDGEEPTCVWSGRNEDHCQTAELTFTEDSARLYIVGKGDSCASAVLTLPLEDFNCCGTNTGWTQVGEPYTPEDPCDLAVTLEPHPCVCCPEPPAGPSSHCDDLFGVVQMPYTFYYDDGIGVEALTYRGEESPGVHYWRGTMTRPVASIANNGTAVDPFAGICTFNTPDTCIETSLGASGTVDLDLELIFGNVDGCWFFQKMTAYGSTCAAGGCISPPHISIATGFKLFCEDSEACATTAIDQIDGATPPSGGYTVTGDIATYPSWVVTATDPHFSIQIGRTITTGTANAFIQAPGWDAFLDPDVNYTIRVYC